MKQTETLLWVCGDDRLHSYEPKTSRKEGVYRSSYENHEYSRRYSGPCSEPQILCSLFYLIWKVLKFPFFLCLKISVTPEKHFRVQNKEDTLLFSSMVSRN